MEPPGPHLRGRSKAADGVHLSAGPLRLAAAAAAAALALTSSGEVVLLSVLLGVAAADVAAGAAAALALGAVAVRWGSTSLGAMAGAQAVLGPGATTGSLADVTVVWSSAAALVLAGRRGWPAPVFAAAAVVGLAAPTAGGGMGDLALRLAAVLVAVVVTVAAGHRVPPGGARTAALVLATAALGLAVTA